VPGSVVSIFCPRKPSNPLARPILRKTEQVVL